MGITNASSTTTLSTNAIEELPINEPLGSVACPICSQEFINLQKLNKHLDRDHGFDNTRNKSSSSLRSNSQKLPTSVGGSPKKQGKQQRIRTTHWEQLGKFPSTCGECNCNLNDSVGATNCRKCGKLYCGRHCRHKIKLNLNAKYDAESGKWYICCKSCYNKRPGYNDYGSYKDLTDDFVRYRNSNSEDKALRLLQLEVRLVKLVDGVFRLYKRYNSNVIMRLKFSNEVSKLERIICPWKDDQNVVDCEICIQPFTLTVRKHHCRLCGSVVCDDPHTMCSKKIPIQLLVNASKELPFKEAEKFKNIKDIQYSALLCTKCTNTLYLKRMFKQSMKEKQSNIIQLYENMNDTSKVILKVLSTFEVLLLQVENSKKSQDSPSEVLLKDLVTTRGKVMRNFSAFNLVVKQINQYKPKNATETKIQKSLQITASEFVNKNIIPLKSLNFNIESGTSICGSSLPNIIDTGPQVKKLSDLLFNNLTIKEVKEYREELMVLKEQSFLVQSMVETAKTQRKFEELKSLDENLKDLNVRIEELENKLGEEGFS
ncbi:hypothetical protein TBLA_0H01910 [Henningerozyma blattae CBS 6284]|uniref:FYVE-type domain-containing protein n=1 Tax=Henningerozyma blattae (strain ATCC 34711 / CBS 6284 / DSM 70876 / NBRC 10599 / NRRL Y-10934 / UCD 77-7) TaxID=1071380 RepID=I2H7X5_HENB6|nr:hypothetical protein TBLA_0H01910 [Tetrapisispora blattae CBS 6284]CCH62477.1 hypothetical protein TBLA_0H01910 [Tetrapisispora blattae CBS 6284]